MHVAGCCVERPPGCTWGSPAWRAGIASKTLQGYPVQSEETVGCASAPAWGSGTCRECDTSKTLWDLPAGLPQWRKWTHGALLCAPVGLPPWRVRSGQNAAGLARVPALPRERVQRACAESGAPLHTCVGSPRGTSAELAQLRGAHTQGGPRRTRGVRLCACAGLPHPERVHSQQVQV